VIQPPYNAGLLIKTFDVIINCAAYTAVDKAESEPALAKPLTPRPSLPWRVLPKKKNIALIHISTDYVFDGKNFKPYLETDPTDPQGVLRTNQA